MKTERITALFCILILVFFLKPLLIGQTILAHDNFYWNFPIFHYTAVTLMNGALPLWDPFSNGGQPFYPHLIQFRLLEPVILFTILAGQLLTKNTVILFNLSKILQTLAMCLGAYLCLSRYTTKTMTRVFLIPVLLFSSFSLGAFHQDGILSQFVWIPWLMHFLLCIFFEKDYRWSRFLFVALTIGLSWQSYQFVGTWTFLFFFFLGLLFFYRKTLSEFWSCPGNPKKTGVASLVVLSMMVMNLSLIAESSRFVFPLRMAPKDFKEMLMKDTGLLPSEVEPGDVEIGIKMPYEMIPYTGAMVKVWELIQTFSPNANANIHSYRYPDTWGTPSEAYIYIGLLGWALCLFGFSSGQSAQRKLWLFITTLFGLLMMGPPGGLHRALFYIFPPLWFIRHTTLFVLFFLFGCLYFFISGFEKIQEKDYRFRIPRSAWATILPFAVVLFTFFVLATKLDYPVFKFPETNLLFIIFLVLAIAGWKVFSMTGKVGFWFSLMLGQVALVVFLAANKTDAVLHFILFLAIPLAFLYVFKVSKKGRVSLRVGIFLLFLSDLLYGFWSAGRLYQSQETPEKLFGFSMAPRPITLQQRDVYPTYPQSLYGRQAPRYLSLLHQKPFALSGVLFFRGSEGRNYPQDLGFALASKRWNTYLLEKNYFEFIHLEIPDSLKSKLFHIGRTPLQFYTAGVHKSDFLKQATTGVAEATLDNFVVLEDHEPLPAIPPFEKNAQITTHQYSYNHWKGQVESKSGGYLLFADGYDKFWKATVDGKPAKVLKMNLNSKGLFLSPGSHEVTFRYFPLPFLVSSGIFLLIPLLVLFGLFAQWLPENFTKFAGWREFLGRKSLVNPQ